MSNQDPVEQSLVAAVEAIVMARGAPIVEFENATPSGWNAVIAAMGAAFFYKDENEKPIGNEQQQRPGPLYSGGVSYVQGTRQDCCSRVVIAISVVINGKTQTLTGEVKDTPKRCFLRTRFKVAPKKTQTVANDPSSSTPYELEIQLAD